MNKSQALRLLKSAIELPDFKFTPAFSEFANSLIGFVKDQRIFFEIGRNNFGEALLIIDKALFNETNFKPYYFKSDLETFNFKEKINLTIDDIKELLKIDLLQFHTVNDIAGNVTDYCQHWDNHRRIAVRIDRGLMKRLKDDRYISLYIKKDTIHANLGYYHKFIIKEYFDRISNSDMDDGFYDDNSSYEKYGGYNGYDDDTIDNAFEGDPSNTWNVD